MPSLTARSASSASGRWSPKAGCATAVTAGDWARIGEGGNPMEDREVRHLGPRDRPEQVTSDRCHRSLPMIRSPRPGEAAGFFRFLRSACRLKLRRSAEDRLQFGSDRRVEWKRLYRCRVDPSLRIRSNFRSRPGHEHETRGGGGCGRGSIPRRGRSRTSRSDPHELSARRPAAAPGADRIVAETRASATRRSRTASRRSSNRSARRSSRWMRSSRRSSDPTAKGKAGRGIRLRRDGEVPRRRRRRRRSRTTTSSAPPSPTKVYVTLSDGRILQPTRIWADPESDIALLQLDDDDAPGRRARRQRPGADAASGCSRSAARSA